MIVQHNIPAINAHRYMGINNKGIAGNLEKLSSGFRINRAADDAAGLAISEKMRGQIRGLSMAEQNTSHGINLIQTAEGGLGETQAILQRMRELAVQSSNGTYQDEDREQITKEFEALKAEVTRIADSTHYNNIKLLNGNLDSSKIAGATSTFKLSTIAAGTVGFAAATDTLAAPDVSGKAFSIYSAYDNKGNISYYMEIDGETYIGEYDDVDNPQAVTFKVDGSPNDRQVQEGAYHTFTYTLTAGEQASASFGMTSAGGNGGYQSVEKAFVGTQFNGIMSTLTGSNATIDSGKGVVTSRTTTTSGDAGNALVFQIGANGGADQRVSLKVADMAAKSIGIFNDKGVLVTGKSLQDASISNIKDANQAIEIIEAANVFVSGQRAQLGALQNRLESTKNSLGVSKENLTAAESTIRDVDMAAEMMAFTKNSILVQASQAMLAQANQLPQGVLQLLR